jgi:RHS repeat-associated protein
MTDARGKATSYSYDGSARLLAITDPLGHSRHYNYDANSNLIAETDELGRTTAFEYDEFRRLKKATYPPATEGAPPLFETTSYDVLGNITDRTDKAGRTTRLEYDNANRVSRVFDPAGHVTHFGYDNRSLTTEVVDALGQRYGFVYDKLGRLTDLQRGEMTMSFSYDEVGNQIARRDFKDQLTTYRYDRLNRLMRISYPDDSRSVYRYDDLSRLVAAANAHGRITFQYDNLNRLTKSKDASGRVISYSYDANGNRLTMAIGSTTDATYEYDELNRLLRIVEGPTKVNNFSYDAAGRVIGRALANGVNTLYEYDALNRLIHLRDSRGSTLLSDHRYSYDDSDNLLQDTEGSTTHSYQFDLLNRLLSAASSGNIEESYNYDALGNRISSHSSATYSYNSFNQLASTSFANLTYDLNGNLVSKQTTAGDTQYSWDFENRLVAVVTSSGQTLNYKYDALGRRIERWSSRDGITSFVYDGAEVVKDQNDDGTAVHYLNGAGVDNKLRQKGSGESLYYLSDQLGSTRLLTDNRGRIVERLAYDSFGNVQRAGGSPGRLNTRYDFTGRERDAETGLIYYRARWYDPQLGRFISEDPIGLTAGLNQYSYVGNNPLTRKDPWGLYEIDVHYYLTYYLALKSGCFSDAEARIIANGDQGVDENPATRPGPGWKPKWYDPSGSYLLWGEPDYRQQQVNMDYHALHPGSHEPYLQRLWNGALSNNDLSALGIYLHYFQDTFSHAGYDNPAYGHGLDLHHPDKTASDISKAVTMAQQTWYALISFGKQKCKCQPKEWDDASWGQVRRFAAASGGPDRRSINAGELQLKRQILGVAAR